MLDLTYAYEFEKDHIRRNWELPLLCKNGLRHINLEGCYILPPVRYKKRQLATVLDTEMKEVPFARTYYGSDMVVGGTYPFSESSADTIECDGVYLGFFFNHWGHFLIDSCARLYRFREYAGAKFIFSTAADFDENRLLPQIIRFFAILGITRDDLVFIKRPTRISRLNIDEAAYSPENYYTREFVDLFEYVRDHVRPSPDIAAYERIYFSKSRHSKPGEKEFGMEILDEMFKTVDFQTIYPEQATLDDQVYWLNTCKEYAFPGGTCAHNLLFAHNSGCRALYMRRSHWIERAQLESAKIANVSVNWLDFYASPYPVSIRYAKFAYICNDNMRRFIADRGCALPEGSIFTDAHSAIMLRAWLNSYPSRLPGIYPGDVSAQTTFSPAYFDVGNLLEYLKLAKDCKLAFAGEEITWMGDAIRKFASLAHDTPIVLYDLHFSNIGWIGAAAQGSPDALAHSHEKVEALRIWSPDFGVEPAYQIFYKGSGWGEEISSGGVAGTTGQRRSIDGVRIWLPNNRGIHSIEYRIYSGCWSEWAQNGEALISPDGIRAIEISVSKKDRIRAVAQ